MEREWGMNLHDLSLIKQLGSVIQEGYRDSEWITLTVSKNRDRNWHIATFLKYTKTPIMKIGYLYPEWSNRPKLWLYLLLAL